MKSVLRCIPGSVFFTILVCSGAAVIQARAAAAEDVSQASCPAAFHQFDFWVGDWDVFDVNPPHRVARARIDSILNGCVLHEDYQGAEGHEGQSLTIYDLTRNVWHQTWVTNRGDLLEIEGNIENGDMVLRGKNQRGALVRGTWKPVNGEVRETAATSTDNGNSWEPWFDIVFRRATGRAAANDAPTAHDDRNDKEAIAAVDAQYQEAVKRNDAVTMGRILADDFVLVTSSGRAYGKTELLDEARGARRTYEHQEDSEKTVRIWDDTAIVTAKLWEKGTENGKPFEHKLWFSDVYRSTPAGWRYVFAQSAYRSCEGSP